MSMFCRRTAVLALAMLGGFAAPTDAQERNRFPNLRAALQELREARKELKSTSDAWPPGYRDRALNSIGQAIDSLKTILSVKDEDNFRGIDRSADYYKRYSNYPRLRAALQDLRQARDELHTTKVDVGDLKQNAHDHIEMAIGDILTLIRYSKR